MPGAGRERKDPGEAAADSWGPRRPSGPSQPRGVPPGTLKARPEGEERKAAG